MIAMLMLMALASGTVYIGSVHQIETVGQNIELPTHEIDSRQSLLMPLFSSIMLVLLFYFFDYVQYILIVCLIFSASSSLFLLLHGFLRNSCNTSGRNIFKQIAIVIITTASVFEWLRTGNFIAHDLLGCSMAVVFIITLRFPSLKVAFICLTALLIYDIFWVFYSEYWFQSNVMVTVATQNATNPIYLLGKYLSVQVLANFQPNLQLPIKLLMPSNKRTLMLGLGDIVLPGMFVNFAYRIDQFNLQIQKKYTLFFANKKLPFITYHNLSLIGYMIGLMLAFTISIVFQHAQPALIYLVPGVILPVITLAWCRGELLELWVGPKTFDEKS
eukprot:gene9953-20691_t